ncbi:hypothetical protein G6F70_008921 [Rhizopus microsporus]|nr:hypothetical protein G6F70_008921 [Rhizopus microsporus]
MSLTRFFQYQALEKLINLTCKKAERILRDQVCPLILGYQLQTVVDKLAEEQVRILRDDLSWRTFPKKHKLTVADPSSVPTKRHLPPLPYLVVLYSSATVKMIPVVLLSNGRHSLVEAVLENGL